MQLYTITATPVMNEAQAAYFNGTRTELDLDKFNALNLADYESSVAQILDNQGIDGFTIYRVNGYWMGQAEPSFKIEIATDNKQNVLDAAEELRAVYNQDAVMLTNPDGTVVFIEK